MPLGDWQFWVVSLMAVLGLWLLIRPLLPKRSGHDPACPTCPSGGSTKRRKAHRATLTIEKEQISRR